MRANAPRASVGRFRRTPALNLIEGPVRRGPEGRLEVVTTSGVGIAVPPAYGAAYAGFVGRTVILGIRPEDLHEAPHRSDWQPIGFSTVAVEALGAEVVLVGQIGPTEPTEISA